MPDSPNIVFIHSESMDGRKMGCMGHPALKNATPNMDRIAREGVLYRNAYTNCPVCNPSRASMWTGKYPSHRDCWNNYEGLRDGVQTFQDTLNAVGYRTKAIGPIDYAHGKHSIRDRVGSWTRAAMIERSTVRTPLQMVVGAGEANQRDWEHTNNAIKEISEASRDGRPFWTYLTTGLVHPAFVAEQRHLDLIDKDAIDIPLLFGLEGTTNPAVRQQRILKNCDTEFSENMVREIRHIYFAMIAALDEMVGRVLQHIDDLGLADSTYVIFSSDHGEMAGEQNQVLKRSMFEASSHVPLIVRGPGIRRGVEVDTPVSLIDLYRTFMDMANANYDDFADRPGYAESLDGESLLPQLTAGSEREQDWAFCEYHGDRVCTGTFMLRQAEWKLIRHMGYDSELYSLVDDPCEIDDVSGKSPDVVTRLEGVLDANFDCKGIDTRAKAYDREEFLKWRDKARLEGVYEDTMAHVYSGFDRQTIEDMRPWTKSDEDQIEAWLAS
ncbi:MAG: sulfatase-like hydrolase/transferase [Candidatus Latescibacterota bacterium]|nr:sulfatase-like hydrolase/transferase [Candidatus Latescibacterota bacterium]